MNYVPFSVYSAQERLSMLRGLHTVRYFIGTKVAPPYRSLTRDIRGRGEDMNVEDPARGRILL
jgi:hypothetical protein